MKQGAVDCAADARRTNLTMRQLAAVFGVSKSTAARVIEDLGPALALRPPGPIRPWCSADRGRHPGPDP